MYFMNGLMVLIQSLVSFFIYLLLLRLLLQKLKANFFNSVIQVLVKLTDVLVKPLRKVIPSVKNFDGAIVLLVLILQALVVLLSLYFQVFHAGAVWGLLIAVVAELGNKLMHLYFFAILIQAVMSWLPQLQGGALSEVLFLLTEPLMKRARRWIPSIAGMDLSPIPVLIVLRMVSYFVFNPMMTYGMQRLLN